MLNMVKLNICGNYFTIALHQEFLVFSHSAEHRLWEFQEVVQCGDNVKKSNDAAIECCAFSPCGKYFGVCFDRNIKIYGTSDWGLIFSSLAERKTSSLQFFPCSRMVLLADKSGSASFYSFEEDKLKKSEIVLGHNSMLTGALVTEDEKIVLTCDRDEKIRVSNYPNVYNIKNYCLGHKMFVSCINFLPTDKRILISSSGDGSIRLWDFILGKQLAIFDIDKVDDTECKCTVLKFVTWKQNSMSLIAFTVYQSNQIRILGVKGNFTDGFKIDLIKILNLEAVPLDIGLQDDTLICLLPNKQKPITFWSLDENNLNETIESFTKVNEYLTGNWDLFVQISSKICDHVPVLFKREIDNLQEYEQRKKARLLKTGRTS